jgi:ParB family chromosome partitioning protein
VVNAILQKEKEYRTVPVDDIEVWDEANVRHTEITRGIDELAESIRQIGLLQPPLVQEIESGKYKLIEGQRRFLAVKQLGWKKIQVLLLRKPIDLALAKLASLSENLHRKAVNPDDVASACEYLSKYFGSDKEAAKVLGISLPTFKKNLAYRIVPEELKELVRKKIISAPDAKRLARIVPDISKAIKFAMVIHGLPKLARDRHFAALLEDPTSTLDEIKARAARSQYRTAIRIHLPETYAYAMYRASRSLGEEPESLAQKAVMDWLDNSGYVK